MSCIIFSILLLKIVGYVLTENIIVTISNGKIEGRKEVTYQGTSFYAFQQIPYGKAATFWRRFANPEPVDNWVDVLDATKNTKICYQTGHNHSSYEELETEDCLFVNVYTPMLQNENSDLAVMFYIHGGGFLRGNANFYSNGPHWLMENGIIVVTVSYRLGPFGFLSTGDKVLPGNFGLKDQVLALKWVRENIKYFGGNRNKITIVGSGAGAACVGYHLQSSKSQGLFRAAIAMSGSNLAPWAYQTHSIEHAYILSTTLGFSVFNSNNIVDALREKTSAEQLRDTASTGFSWLSGPNSFVQGFSFTPYSEYDFIDENAYDAIENGKMNRVPLMIGITSEEMLFTGANFEEIIKISEQFDDNLTYLVSYNMHLANWKNRAIAGQAIREIYTNGSFQDDVSKTIRYYSDNCFTKSAIHHAKLQARFSDVYFYQFSYHGDMGENPIYIEGADTVQHGEDEKYIWCSKNNSNINNYNAEDVLTSTRYRTLITNFIKSMNPTPENSDILQNITWPKVSTNHFQYLDIGTNLVIKKNPKADTYSQWVEVYDKFVVKPYDTF